MEKSREFLLGFDVGGTKCAAVLGERSGDELAVVDKSVFATAEYPEPEKCIRRFAEAMRELVDRHRVVKYSGLGISCGGPLDAERGVVLSPPNLPGWDEVPVAEMLSREFGCPARLCNDADACAVAEWRFGAGRGCRNMIFLTFGTGLGAGLILDGKLYYGKSGFSGEIGHFPFLDNDKICRCGKKGCLETGASGTALYHMIKEQLQQGRTSLLSKKFKAGEKIVLDDILKAVEEEDVLSIEGIGKVGDTLGRAIAGLINIFNPGQVIIGGRLIVGGDYLMLPIRTAVHRYSLNRVSSDTEIFFSTLGRKAAGVGDCLIARARLLGLM